MRPKILTVDDARTVRQIAHKVLRDFDCDSHEATNGYNALFAMERALPDLILLDVSMPVMGGLEMLTLMKSNPALKQIPVIMLTSRADHAIMPQLAALGVNEILLKPFSETDLLGKIGGIIELKPLA